jgi:hypothetical protein
VKKIGEMSTEELAGLVCDALKDVGVTVTLTGGACVAIWSEGKYVSDDLDFVEEGPVPPRKVQVLRAPAIFVRHSSRSLAAFVDTLICSRKGHHA